MSYFAPMSRNTKTVGAVLTAAAMLSIITLARETKNASRDYQPIIDRNAFGLKPPPEPPVVAPVTNPPPKAEFYFVGYTTLGYPKNPKRAYFAAKDPAKKNGNFSLLEGQQSDGLTLLEVNEKTRSIKVHTAEGDRIMDFKNDGVPTAKGAPGPGMPGGPPPLPGMHPGGMPPNNFGTPIPGANNYPNGLPANPALNNPGMNNGQTPTPGTRSLPIRPVRTPLIQADNPTMTPEQQFQDVQALEAIGGPPAPPPGGLDLPTATPRRRR
jgi:hypothetical protein